MRYKCDTINSRLIGACELTFAVVSMWSEVKPNVEPILQQHRFTLPNPYTIYNRLSIFPGSTFVDSVNDRCSPQVPKPPSLSLEFPGQYLNSPANGPEMSHSTDSEEVDDDREYEQVYATTIPFEQDNDFQLRHLSERPSVMNQIKMHNDRLKKHRDEVDKPTSELWHDDYHSPQLAVGLGIGIGVMVLILVAMGLIFLLVRRKRRRTIGLQRNSGFPITHNNSYKTENQLKGVNRKADLWELDRAALSIFYDEKLGCGAFCNVFKGEIIGQAPVCKVYPSMIAISAFKNCTCAVKMLPTFADSIAKSDFFQEINFMKSLRYHSHLISMLGWVADKDNPLLLVEYCEQGDLLHLVRNKREEILKAYQNVSSSMKIKDLVSFGWQISNGLEYLSSIGCVHRDIAARNILVDAANVCKIGDFGLCRLSNCLLYVGRGGRLPLKWMAPESLRSYEYSKKSDVWSYGVLLFEIFSFGEVPYALVENSDLLEFLDSGKRLMKPLHCPKEIYTLMLSCWEADPDQRPSFSDICSQLRDIIEAASDNYGYVQPIQNSSVDEMDYETNRTIETT